MSRSRRKTPIIGRTWAPSEKADKQEYNRRYRHIFKIQIHKDPFTEVWPTLRDYSDDWGMSKDGKYLFDPGEWPALMRK
jgi:hypothetical protein